MQRDKPLHAQSRLESRPTRHKQQFHIVGTDRRLPDEKLDVWVPAVGEAGKTYFRAVGGLDEWHFMADTKPGIPDVEFPLPMSAATQPTTRP